jgi:zinc transport system permease protein
VSVAIIAYNYRSLLYASFDEESAKVHGIPVDRINTILMILTAVVVSVSMRIVGILLVGALMVIPVITAMQIGRSMKQSLFISLILSFVSVLTGLTLAFYANLPAGGIIVLTSFVLYFVVSISKFLRLSYGK